MLGRSSGSPSDIDIGTIKFERTPPNQLPKPAETRREPGGFFLHHDKENDFQTFAAIRDQTTSESNKLPAAPASVPAREPLRELSIDEQMLHVIQDRFAGIGTDFENSITHQHDLAIKNFISKLQCKQLTANLTLYDSSILKTNDAIHSTPLV